MFLTLFHSGASATCATLVARISRDVLQANESWRPMRQLIVFKALAEESLETCHINVQRSPAAALERVSGRLVQHVLGLVWQTRDSSCGRLCDSLAVDCPRYPEPINQDPEATCPKRLLKGHLDRSTVRQFLEHSFGCEWVVQR
jgi:hypothetical protein